jgi:hypothetical protein
VPRSSSRSPSGSRSWPPTTIDAALVLGRPHRLSAFRSLAELSGRPGDGHDAPPTVPRGPVRPVSACVCRHRPRRRPSPPDRRCHPPARRPIRHQPERAPRRPQRPPSPIAPDAHERAAANPCFDPTQTTPLPPRSSRAAVERWRPPAPPWHGFQLRSAEAEVVSRRQVPTSGISAVRTFAVVERGLRLKKLCLPGTGVDASASTPSVRANGAPQAGPRPRPEPAFGGTAASSDHWNRPSGAPLEFTAPPVTVLNDPRCERAPRLRGQCRKHDHRTVFVAGNLNRHVRCRAVDCYAVTKRVNPVCRAQ